MSQASTVAGAISDTAGLVSISVGAQVFGVPVMRVQDVIAATDIHHVPLAPPEVAGSLNLRGRIVTAIDLRRRLQMQPRDDPSAPMSVIVERAGELYALQVDDVGDVLWLPAADHEPAPVTLSALWRSLTTGLYRLDDGLLLVLNIDQILNIASLAT